MTAAVERSPGMINVHSFEGGGKTVRITFASDLTVGDDVEARAFLIPDRQDCGIILGLFEPFRRNTP